MKLCKFAPLFLLASVALAGCDRGGAEPRANLHDVLPAGESFSCKPVRVWDGDTFGCAELRSGAFAQERAKVLTVRLSGIAAREVRLVGRLKETAENRRANGQRERKGSFLSTVEDAGCRSGHPCPATSGVAARKALARMLTANVRSDGGGSVNWQTLPTGHILVNGPELQCTSTGSAGGKRVGAWCVSPIVGDLSCAMIRGGYAMKWERYWRDHHC